MKLCLIITSKLLLIYLGVFYLYDPAAQLLRQDSSPICLRTDSPLKLCAQCYRRSARMLESKGYHVVGPGASGVLKIPLGEEYLSCGEMLQMVDF